MAMAGDDQQIRNELLAEHAKLMTRIARWRTETTTYRWLNIIFFMMCKLLVPTGALVVAIDMIAVVMSKPFLGHITSAVIAVTITFLASLEAMLNPGSKKRLAFNLNNELSSIEYELSVTKISDGNEELRNSLMRANVELKRLLNNYSENGY